MDEFLDGIKRKLSEEGTVYFGIKVIPNASKTEFVELMGDDKTVKIRAKAVPEKGKANKAVEKFLRSYFKGDCEIVGGRQSREKLVRISI